MKAKQSSLHTFTYALSSAAPAPGGGAAVGVNTALGISLALMVANLTLNKKGYEKVQEDIQDILQKGELLREQALDLVDEDAQAFLDLMKIYTQKPISKEEKQQHQTALTLATHNAAQKPLMMLKVAKEALLLHLRLQQIGNKNLLSDVATGATLLKSAMEGAAVNVWVNTKNLPHDEETIKLKKEVAEILETECQKADNIYQEITQCWR